MQGITSKKKILQLRSSLGFFGAENVIAELVRESVYSRYIPIIGVLNNKKNPHLELIDFAQKHNISSEIFDCRWAFDLKTILAIRNFIKINNIDIVQTHGYKANLYILFATLFEKIPLMATCHPWIKTGTKIKLYSIIDKMLLNRFSKIIAVSEEVKREILDIGIPSKKVFVIPNGINVDRFGKKFEREKILLQFGIPIDSKVVGTVGRLSSEKGHVTLIEAAKRIIMECPSTYLVIAGDGVLKNKLKDRAKELGIYDHFLFTGMIYDIPKLLSIIDIFVLPSLTEGLPMALLEAMVAKKPVIASNVGSISDLIIHDKTGLLVPAADISGLEKSVLELLSNKAKAEKLAKNGYKVIINSYTSRIMAGKYIDIYDELLAPV